MFQLLCPRSFVLAAAQTWPASLPFPFALPFLFLLSLYVTLLPCSRLPRIFLEIPAAKPLLVPLPKGHNLGSSSGPNLQNFGAFGSKEDGENHKRRDCILLRSTLHLTQIYFLPQLSHWTSTTQTHFKAPDTRAQGFRAALK